jgi:hypothetical protein
MRPQPLTLRVSGGPLVTEGGHTGRDAVHVWVPMRDDAWAITSTLDDRSDDY